MTEIQKVKRVRSGQEWKRGLPVFDEIPIGWLTIADAAIRAGMRRDKLSTDVTAGRFPKSAIGLWQTNGKRITLLHWDAAIYDYLLSRPATSRPADFVRNDLKSYKPISTIDTPARGSSPFPTADEVTDQSPTSALDALLNNQDQYTEKVVDLTSARFRAEQLKILKLQYELRVARNELIAVAEVDSLLREIAVEIKSEFTRMESAIAPVFAACSDPREIRRVLRDELARALAPLERGRNGAAESTD